MNRSTITRMELTDALVREIGLTRQDSAALLGRVLELISEGLENDNVVKLSRFGHFRVRRKNARTGRNPKTGIEAKITGRRAVTFKPSSIFKSSLDS